MESVTTLIINFFEEYWLVISLCVGIAISCNVITKYKPNSKAARVIGELYEFLMKIYSSKDLKRVLAVVSISFLMWADYSAVMHMLWNVRTSTAGVTKDTVALFGLALAFLLEGLPAFAGGCLSSLLDSASTKKNDHVNAAIGLLVSGVASVVVLAFVWNLRGIYNAGMFSEDSDISEVVLYEFLRISPIFTSVFSFIISWRWMRIDQIELHEIEVEKLRIKKQICEGEYTEALKRYNDARSILWTLLTENEDMPKDVNKFNNYIYRRVRTRLLLECTTSFSNQVNLFDSRILSELESFLVEMAEHSNMKDEIIAIRISDLIQSHDEKNADNPILCWNAENAKIEYEKMIESKMKKEMLQYQSAIYLNDYPSLF